MNHVTHPMSPAGISNFSPEISKVFYIKKYMYRLHFDTKFLVLCTFLESLKIVLIKQFKILIMSAKMTAQGILKTTIFWNKGYYVINHVHDITDKILSLDSDYIVDVTNWPKFGNYSISMKEIIIISIL